MAIVSSSSFVKSSSDIFVQFDAFPNVAGSTVNSADGAFKTSGGAYGTLFPAQVGDADPSLGLPPGSVSCSADINPGGAGGTLTVRCRVLWSDGSTDVIEFPVVVVVAPPDGAHLEYNVSKPEIRVGESTTITATLVSSEGVGVPNVRLNLALDPLGATATGNLSLSQGTTDGDGNLSTDFTATGITGSGNKGQAKINATAGSSATDPHRLIVIHVKS